MERRPNRRMYEQLHPSTCGTLHPAGAYDITQTMPMAVVMIAPGALGDGIVRNDLAPDDPDFRPAW